MNIPEDLRYTKNDEWIKLDGDSATVGITDYAQDQLSDIVYFEASPGEGDSLKQGDAFGTVESVKAASDVYTPAAGELEAVNAALADAPEAINSDPYGSWMIKLKIADASQVEALMDAAAYKAYIEEREA
jgi:glycine cleavage system H protein